MGHAVSQPCVCLQFGQAWGRFSGLQGAPTECCKLDFDTAVSLQAASSLTAAAHSTLMLMPLRASMQGLAHVLSDSPQFQGAAVPAAVTPAQTSPA